MYSTPQKATCACVRATVMGSLSAYTGTLIVFLALSGAVSLGVSLVSVLNAVSTDAIDAFAWSLVVIIAWALVAALWIVSIFLPEMTGIKREQNGKRQKDRTELVKRNAIEMYLNGNEHLPIAITNTAVTLLAAAVIIALLGNYLAAYGTDYDPRFARVPFANQADDQWLSVRMPVVGLLSGWMTVWYLYGAAELGQVFRPFQ